MVQRPMIAFLAILCLCAVRCGQENAISGALPVFVSIAPQKYIVDKIGGSLVAAAVMVEPGASPHSYEPKPSQMIALSRAQAYFSIGLEFEKVWLPRFRRLNGVMAVVPMDSGIVKKPVDLFGNEPAQATSNAEERDPPAGMDPHIWLSPQLVKKQATAVCTALCRLDPGHDSAYRANCRAFEAEIAAVQDSVRTILQSIAAAAPRRTFMVFHPSWAYFADEFNCRQVAIEIEGKEPSARQLETIIETANKNAIHTIFVQPQFSQRSAQIIARQIQARIAIADDLAYDWKNNLIAFAKAIADL